VPHGAGAQRQVGKRAISKASLGCERSPEPHGVDEVTRTEHHPGQRDGTANGVEGELCTPVPSLRAVEHPT
jgi:hypothetical protein